MLWWKFGESDQSRQWLGGSESTAAGRYSGCAIEKPGPSGRAFHESQNNARYDHLIV